MTINHHCNDETILAYAAGALPEGLSLVTATHLAVCGQCRKRVQEAEDVGGALVETLESAPLGENALDNVLARLDEPAREPEKTPRRKITDPDLPGPLADYLGRPLKDVNWRTLAPGVQQVNLTPKGEKGTVRLLKIKPGTYIPEHSHHGSELTVVLKGSYTDEFGRFGAGDVADLDPDARHQPIADTDEPCICLIATDAPLKFSGVMGRIMQPFLGI